MGDRIIVHNAEVFLHELGGAVNPFEATEALSQFDNDVDALAGVPEQTKCEIIEP